MDGAVDSDFDDSHFRLMIEASPSGMLMVDQAGTVVIVNATIEKMFGYKRDEIVGHSVDILVPSGLRAHHARLREDYSKAPSMRIMGAGRDLRGVRKDGSEFPVEIGLNPIATNARTLILGIVLDITARKNAEQALIDSERQYFETFEAAPVAMCWISPEGRYLRTNRAFQKLSGYTQADLSHMGPTDTCHPNTLDATRQRIADLVDGSIDHVEGESQFIRKDGHAIWLYVNMALIRRRDGTPDYLLAHLQDITARKTAESQLVHAQKMEAIGSFAGGIAHDFNNMLVPILGLTQLVKEDLPTDSPLHENVDMVLDAAEKARNLVRQILTFSRQDESVVTAIDLSSCIFDAVSLLRTILPSTIKVHDSIHRDVGIIMADAAQIQTIVMNLGSNAVAAIGNKVGELRISLTRMTMDQHRTQATQRLPTGDYAKFSLADSGSGMSDTTLARIFDPFFTTKAPGEGTGLGLSMVHGIIERCGGAIEVTSRIGAGTRFDIYLPIVGGGKRAA